MYTTTDARYRSSTEATATDYDNYDMQIRRKHYDTTTDEQKRLHEQNSSQINKQHSTVFVLFFFYLNCYDVLLNIVLDYADDMTLRHSDNSVTQAMVPIPSSSSSTCLRDSLPTEARSASLDCVSTLEYAKN